MNCIIKMKLRTLVSVLLMLISCVLLEAKDKARNCQDSFRYNPIIPDFVADPSVVKFGDTFYLYGTTDINNGLKKMGIPVVWKSIDFVNWSFDGSIMPQIDWGKSYQFINQEGKNKTGYFRYWAPGKPIYKNGKYYLFPTIVKPDESLGTYVVVADNPEGPFEFPDGKGVYFNSPENETNEAPKLIEDIDGEPFVDKDGKSYMYWRRRKGAELSEDFKTLVGEDINIATNWGGYSEGPVVFRRNDLYYYIYTLAGHSNYCNGYMISSENPLNGYRVPEGESIFIYSNLKEKIWGPGHGNVFQMPDTDDYYFLYLEYGEAGTTRQVYINKMEFDDKGYIKPMQLSRNGVGYLSNIDKKENNLALNAKVTASSIRDNKTIEAKSIGNPNEYGGNKINWRGGVNVSRTFTYKAENAVDFCNGTRWEAEREDIEPWMMLDLGNKQLVTRVEIAFVFPTFGHSWRLEKSMDGEKWKVCEESVTKEVRSPHIINKIGKARFLRVTVLDGPAGIWEMKVY